MEIALADRRCWRRWRRLSARPARRPAARPDSRPLVVYDLPITRTVTDYEEFPGRTDALYSVQVTARVSGYMTSVYFQDGQEVDEGRQALPDRPPAVQGRPRPGQGRRRAGRGARQAAEQGVQPRQGPVRAGAIDQPGGVRPLRLRPRRGRGGPEARQGQPRPGGLNLEWTEVTAPIERPAQPADGRPRQPDQGRRHDADLDRQPGPALRLLRRPRAGHARIRRLLQEGKLKAKSEKEVPSRSASPTRRTRRGHLPPPGRRRLHRQPRGPEHRHPAVPGQDRQPRIKASIHRPGLFVRVRLPIGDPHPALMVREQALSVRPGPQDGLRAPGQGREGRAHVIKDARANVREDKDGKPVHGYTTVPSTSGRSACSATDTARSRRGSSRATGSSPRACRGSAGDRSPAPRSTTRSLVKARPPRRPRPTTANPAKASAGQIRSAGRRQPTKSLPPNVAAPAAGHAAKRRLREPGRSRQGPPPRRQAASQARSLAPPAVTDRPSTPVPRGASPHRVLPLLHRPADLRRGAVDRDHAGRRARAVEPADRDVSADRAADGQRDLPVSRRQRPGGRRDRGRADRAAGQRRREHDVHVVAVHQRRQLHA